MMWVVGRGWMWGGGERVKRPVKWDGVLYFLSLVRVSTFVRDGWIWSFQMDTGEMGMVLGCYAAKELWQSRITHPLPHQGNKLLRDQQLLMQCQTKVSTTAKHYWDDLACNLAMYLGNVLSSMTSGSSKHLDLSCLFVFGEQKPDEILGGGPSVLHFIVACLSFEVTAVKRYIQVAVTATA